MSWGKLLSYYDTATITTTIKDTTMILIMTLLIMTLLIMTLLTTLINATLHVCLSLIVISKAIYKSNQL
jgi:hypothetical protein